ncbi:hypothetical protein P7K49_008777 [Saguinus oedipus]|uniref:Uncharacterized protein n=1 Tax=Saguinus oedipus TaxID=9490 RepID=A0ABQ9VYQ2_SAGOE|nr:hypothetical protein P7K49_008777 [Saguinus oedipus]
MRALETQPLMLFITFGDGPSSHFSSHPLGEYLHKCGTAPPPPPPPTSPPPPLILQSQGLQMFPSPPLFSASGSFSCPLLPCKQPPGPSRD